MTSRADTVAAGSSDPPLNQTSLQDHQCFFIGPAHDFTKSSNDFPIWRCFRRLEKQVSSTEVFLAARYREQIEDPVVVDFIHGDHNGVFSVRRQGYSYVTDVGKLRQRGGSLRKSALGHVRCSDCVL